MTPSASWCHTPPGRVTPLRTSHRVEARARRRNVSIGVKDARRPKRRPVASEESTPSGGVDPTRVFTHPTANKRLATPRHIGRAGPQTGPTGRRRIGEGSDACGRCCSAHWNLRGRGHSPQTGAAGGRAPEGSESQGALRDTAARESRSPGFAGNRSFRARNTGGATSNTRPHMRAPRPANAGRGMLTRRGAKV